MTTVSIHMPENTGLTGFTLYLRKTSDGTLVNTGDALTESPSGSGRFTATVAEAWTETLAAVVLDGSLLAVRDGWLASGETIVRDSNPVVDVTVNANLTHIANAPVAVDTGTAGTISFVSGQYVATSGDTVNANVVQVAGENVHDDGNGRMEVVGGGGGDVQISSEAVVVARLPIGATVGWPQTLMIGNAYLQATQTAPKFFVKDIDDNILTALGDKNFTDADFVATLRLSPLTTGENGTVDDNQPATTIEITSDDVVGIVYDDSTSDSEFFWLQIPRAKTLLGEINTRYSAQFIMNWGEDETYEWGINLGEVKFHRKNAAAT